MALTFLSLALLGATIARALRKQPAPIPVRARRR
jgi:hypothetical protein